MTFEVKSEGTGKLDTGKETEYEIIDSIGAVDDILNDSVEEKQSEKAKFLASKTTTANRNIPVTL